MTMFITGGAGFIGCNLADHHLRRGDQVVIFDNLSRRGAATNLAWLQQNHGERVTFVRGDIRDFDALRAALPAGIERVYHMAAQVAVTTSVVNPREDFEINALGTFNVLEAVRANAPGAPLFYASTNKVYGGMEDIVVVEDAQRYRYRDLPLGIPEGRLLDFHSPYGCCYSADTDILTRQGWKRFYELIDADEVLTYNLATKTAEYQRPTAHFAYAYQGKMYVQHNRRLATCVTPNHKMLVAWKRNHTQLERPQLLEAQAIKGKPMAYLLAAELQDGEIKEQFTLPAVKAGEHKHFFPAREIPMTDWLRFLGWYLAEGHCCEAEETGNCTVTLSTYYRTQEAVEVMLAIGLSPVVDKHHIVATSRQLYEYLRQFGKAYDKYIPIEIKGLHPTQLRILLEALLAGDGDPHSKNGWRYTTVSCRLADDVQEIAIRCGLSASVLLDKEGFYRVYICTTRTAHCNLGADRSEWIDYEGQIYCVEVPNSTVMVRQNGCAYFSGNSKGAGDQYVRDYARIYGLKTVVFRQSCIYGRRQFGVEDQGWLAHFCIAARLGRPISIYGNGKQVRDVLWIDDLVAAYDAAAGRLDAAAGQIYNIGGGANLTLSIWTEFGALLAELAGRPIPVTYGDWRPGDQPVYISDIRKAERELGWTPRVSMRDGVTRLWQWIASNPQLFG
jgi:nucleoside-diphosphate-sugar epimerase